MASPELDTTAIVPTPYTEHDSASNHRRMQTSLAEAERLRQTCRAAAASSASRRVEEKVNTDYISESIHSAKAVSSFAKNAESNGPSTEGIPVPAFLVHLSQLRPDPKAQELAEVTLPGAIEEGPEASGPEAASSSSAHAAPAVPMAPIEQQMESSGAPGQVVRMQSHSSASGGTAKEEATMVQLRMSIGQEAPPLVFGDHSAMPGMLQDEISQGSSDDDSDLSSDGWPPKPPLLRFKMRELFAGRFKTSEEMDLLKEANKDTRRTSQITEIDVKTAAVGEMKDMIIGWFNHYFELTITNELQMEVGFPVIVMLMLDAIYPLRVPWCSVDWKLSYKRALTKNFQILRKFWDQVNMDKAREFRVENTSLRLENMEGAVLKEKLAFLKQLKRWFDVRIHHAPPFDPMQRRREIERLCLTRGHSFTYPPWIKHDKDKDEKRDSKLVDRQKTIAFNTMPEYKRLIWFLGSPEHQTM